MPPNLNDPSSDPSSGNGTHSHNVDFVKQFIEFHKEFESPTSFWRWAAYSTIAATLRNNVYYQYGTGRIYPNIYAVLLAVSAKDRKDAPIQAARKLLESLKVTKVLFGSATIQAILEHLALDLPDRSTGIPIKGGSSIVIAAELSAFFVGDPRLVPVLTDIWQYVENYAYRLRSGNIEISHLCMSMFAASNEILLREVFDKRANLGGLLGRTFLIKRDEIRKSNSLMQSEIDEIEVINELDTTELLITLREIKRLNGRVRIKKEAAILYDNWYNELREIYETTTDKTGFLHRMHTNVLKLAIILAASKMSLIINELDIHEAIEQTMALKENYEKFIMASGKSDMAEIGTKFLADLWEAKNHTVARQEFLMKNWSEVSAGDFDKLIETLKSGGLIDFEIGNGGTIHYRMTQKGINMFS